MEAYLVFYFGQIGTVLLCRALGLKDNKLVLGALIAVAACFAGLRGNIGTDVVAYRTFYDEVGSKDGETVFEP